MSNGAHGIELLDINCSGTVNCSQYTSSVDEARRFSFGAARRSNKTNGNTCVYFGYISCILKDVFSVR